MHRVGTHKQSCTNRRAIRQVDQRPSVAVDLGLDRLDLDFLQHVDALQLSEVAEKSALQVEVFGQSCHLAGLGSRGKFCSIKDDACV